MDQTYGRNDSPKVREQRTARYYYEATAEEEAVRHGCSDFPMLRPINSGRITQIRRIERGIAQSISTPNLTFAQRAIHIYGMDDEYVTMMPTTALDHLIDPNDAPSPSSPDSEKTLGSGGSGFSTPTPGGLNHECLTRCPTLIHSMVSRPREAHKHLHFISFFPSTQQLLIPPFVRSMVPWPISGGSAASSPSPTSSKPKNSPSQPHE